MASCSPAPVEIAVAVVEQGGQFLVGLRPAGVVLAGYSEFPGGKIHSGETPEAAAIRECLEETGVAIRVDARYPEVVHRYEFATVRLHFLQCSVVGESQQPAPPFRWVPREELATLQFPDANMGLIAYLLSDL